MVGMARSMMKAKGMPVRFLGEAVTTAVFILNRAPTKALMGKMPFEAWYGHKPSVTFLWTFGYIGHVRNTKLCGGQEHIDGVPRLCGGYQGVPAL